MILLHDVAIHKENYFSPEAMELFNTAMNDDKILNITRLGGCDFEIARTYYANPDLFVEKEYYEKKLLEARNFPGYFDFSNKKENFLLYAEKLVTYFKSCDFATYAGGALLDKIEKDCYTLEDITFLGYILSKKSIMTYGFIESIRPFLNSFKIWGEGKRILIVSPLSKSIQFQYQRKDKIMRDYTYPNFELLTLNTNLTWQHPNDTKEKLGLKTNNWHEECDRLGEEISKLNFDIAWLSCGSYAMYLGYFIKNHMHKKSIYIGGVLNQLFSIYGERYHIYYSSPYNADPEYILNPFENEDVKKITAGREWKSESVNAYFGYRRDK